MSIYLSSHCVLCDSFMGYYLSMKEGGEGGVYIRIIYRAWLTGPVVSTYVLCMSDTCIYIVRIKTS